MNHYIDMSLDLKERTAWMIKNDGSEIPVVTHIYADHSETDELLALAYFLWKHAPESYNAIIPFLDVWSFRELGGRLRSRIFVADELVAAVKTYLLSKPYFIFPEEFAQVIESSASLLKRRGSGEYMGNQIEEIYGTDLTDTLNQCFLRARYGGRYNTTPQCRDMFFRVSSVGFDCFPIIRSFVEKRTDRIGTVTVVRDLESTGCEKYYMDSSERPYNEMPLKDFLNGTGSTNFTIIPPGRSTTSRVAEALANGNAIPQLLLLPANSVRIHAAIQRLKHAEEANLLDE